MAATVNTRDLRLQATNPRIEEVTLPDNVTVPSAQVDGLPDLVLGSKVVYLRASSEVFQIAKSGTVSPASVNLTPVFRNVPERAVWTVVSGTATLTTNGDGSKTLTYANMATDSVTVTITATDGGVDYTDTVTIVKLREGSDTINAVLSNESHTVPADSSGTAITYSGAGTTITIYIGTADTTANWTITKVDSTGVSSSIANNAVTVTSMTASTNSGYVDITATRAGFPSITKRFSLSKTKSGTSGSNGSDGQRGTVNVAKSGYSAWSDSGAASAISGAGYGSPQNRDIVTLYNSSGFSETRFFDSPSWLALSAYVNGNMLVTGTLSADTLSGGTIRGVDINISNNFRVTASTGTAQLFTANLTRCTGSNADAAGIASFTSTSVGTGAAISSSGGSSGDALRITGGTNGINQTGGGSNWLKGLNPSSSNSYALGDPSYLWTTVYASSGAVSTSDQRSKTDIQDNPLGLGFINDLRPVKYKLAVSYNKVEQEVPHHDPDGPNLPEKDKVTPVPGKRYHYGLLAQDVKQTLTKHGVDDAAFWILTDANDSNSQQGLRYEELISPLIKAVQELAQVVKEQGVQIEALAKKVVK